MKNIEIYCVNTSSYHQFPLGTNLSEIADSLSIKTDYPVCGAYVNHQLKELSFLLVKPKRIEFFDLSHPDGLRMYIRSLMFVFYIAAKKVIPNECIRIQHSISNGYYFELDNKERVISKEEVDQINDEMVSLIKQNIPFIKEGLLTEKVLEIFERQGLKDKAKLVEQHGKLYTNIYKLKEYAGYFYGHLLPTTGYLELFQVISYYDGLLLRVPRFGKMKKLCKLIKQDKLFEIYQEHKDWVEILKVATAASLNEFTITGQSGQIIKISEALHEKKVVEITNNIFMNADKIKFVFIAGPSASGKTTFSKRLSIQLAVNGLRPDQISIDDYFVDRDKSPKDENGEFDFESVNAIDISFFNKQLLELLEGKKIEIPKFDFTKGKKCGSGKYLQLKEDDILIIEGIHGMNPLLMPMIDPDKTFKIFISALTQISFDEQNYISTSDNRLIRRIIRDYKYRGYTAAETIGRWDLVRNGEEKNIFPFQENADMMFNSSTIYELGVLKKYAEPLLQGVLENQPEYGEATRLLEFLSYFKPINDDEIPPTSIIREFLGGSSFIY